MDFTNIIHKILNDFKGKYKQKKFSGNNYFYIKYYE